MKKLVTLYGVGIYADTEDPKKINDITRFLTNTNNMFTNLPNEITSTYTKMDWFADFLIIIGSLVTLVGLGILVLEWSGGADAIINYVELI